MITIDQVLKRMKELRYEFLKETTEQNETILHFKSGVTVSVNAKAKAISFGGKNPDKLSKQFYEKPIAKIPDRRVFVVYGRNRSAREQLELLLQQWEIKPLFFDQLPTNGETIIEKLMNPNSRILSPL